MTLVEDQKEVLRDCTARFERLGIEYMLTGSMAMLHYAVGRMTRDIDIIIEVSKTDADAIIEGFQPDYYIPHLRVREAIKRKYMFNLLHQETVVKIDCIVRKDTEFQKIAFENRKKIEYGNFEVWTIGKEDLILSKLHWAKDTKSEMQLRDVANMLRTEYNKRYVRTWAKNLKVEDLLKECLEMLK